MKNYTKSYINFYSIPLICRSVPEIGCGSRSKPVLIDLEKIRMLKEAWLHQSGMTLAIVCATPICDNSLDKLVFKVFEKYKLNAVKLIGIEHDVQLKNFNTNSWYRSNDVDTLSREEADIFANRILEQLLAKSKILPDKQKSLHQEISKFFYGVFQNFESTEQMESNDFFKEKLNQVIIIVSKYIDISKIPSSEILLKAVTNRIIVEKSNDVSNKSKWLDLRSVITCPHCAHQELEIMTVDSCQYFYECKSCNKILKPLLGDCCVFCSYGSVMCPTIQSNNIDNYEK